MNDEGAPVWDLSGLYGAPGDPAIQADLTEAERLVSEISAGEDAADILPRYERANTLLARVAAYATLYEDGRLEAVLHPRVQAIAARAPALRDEPGGDETAGIESRVIATMLSAIAEAGPRLWHRTNLQTEAELLPWTWNEATAIAAEAADGLSPAMGAAVRRVLAERRVHAGAGPPLSHPAGDRGPYVRLVFDGSLKSVLTLAHELGHGAHQLLSRPLGVLRCDPSPVLAETVAATLEMAAARRLGGQGGGERRTLQVLAARDLYAVVVRHGALARMERRGELTDGGWKTAIRVMAGPEALKAERPDAWRGFGVRTRAPGSAWIYPFARLVAAVALDRRDEDPDGFASAWTRLLAAGGTVGPADALADLGVDPSAPGFWSRALALAAR